MFPPQNCWQALLKRSLSNAKHPLREAEGLRKRWKDYNGKIYEWDSRHGAVEVYDSAGRHLGEFNPDTGEQLKTAVEP